MNKYDQNITELSSESVGGCFKNMSQLMPNVLNHMMEEANSPDTLTGVPTCFPSLDFYTSGLQRGDLIVVAGRPSMGKSFFVRDIAMHIALVNQLPVVMLDGEKNGEYQVKCMMATLAKMVDLQLHHSEVDREIVEQLNHHLAFLKDAPIYFSSLIPTSVQELENQLYKLSQETGELGLVVVDCLPEFKMLNVEMHSDVATRIAQSSRYLKTLAQALNVPVIVLSPIEQMLEDRCNKWPLLTDLPGMASIANAADLVLMMYRDEIYNPGSDEKGKANIIVARNRNGFTGTFSLKFNDRYGTFHEV